MNKGRGWHGDTDRHKAVGKLGGNAVLTKNGTDFYSKIGKMGGSASPGNFKNNPDRAREAGKKGRLARWAKKTNQEQLDAQLPLYPEGGEENGRAD